MRTLGKSLLRSFVVLFSSMVLFSQTTYAAFLQSETLITPQIQSANEAKVKAFINRQEVITKLEQYGIDRKSAEARIAALSPSELQMLSQKIDTLPAGSGVGFILAVALAVLLVFLISDATEHTDYF